MAKRGPESATLHLALAAAEEAWLEREICGRRFRGEDDALRLVPNAHVVIRPVWIGRQAMLLACRVTPGSPGGSAGVEGIVGFGAEFLRGVFERAQVEKTFAPKSAPALRRTGPRLLASQRRAAWHFGEADLRVNLDRSGPQPIAENQRNLRVTNFVE